MNTWKKILLGVVVVLIGIQFIKPARNISQGTQANSIATVFTTPSEVQDILKVSCNDCHSNNTIYPWYANVQPVAWWLQHHVNEGKEEINFDEFATYSPRRQHHKLEEMAEMINEGEMPLNSYTWIHKDAVLSAEKKQMLLNWTKEQITAMEAKYPKDSLEMPKRPKP